VEGESLRVAPTPVLTNALRDLAVEAARRGGTVLKSYYGAQGRIAMKADGAGPVTDACVLLSAAFWDGRRLQCERDRSPATGDGARPSVSSSRTWDAEAGTPRSADEHRYT